MHASPLTERLAAANAAGRVGLIPFLTAGYPGREEFWRVLDELDQAGADILVAGSAFFQAEDKKALVRSLKGLI